MREFKWCEKIMRIKIVFPSLFVDAKPPVLFSFRVRKHLVDLPAGSGDLIALVLQANDELLHS